MQFPPFLRQKRERLNFGLAAAVSAVGGTLIGLSFGFEPTTGTGWLLRSFTVVVLGGLGSLWGSFLGGILIGMLEEVAASQVGPQYFAVPLDCGSWPSAMMKMPQPNWE